MSVRPRFFSKFHIPSHMSIIYQAHIALNVPSASHLPKCLKDPRAASRASQVMISFWHDISQRLLPACIQQRARYPCAYELAMQQHQPMPYASTERVSGTALAATCNVFACVAPSLRASVYLRTRSARRQRKYGPTALHHSAAGHTIIVAFVGVAHLHAAQNKEAVGGRTP